MIAFSLLVATIQNGKKK
ncbi:hypothetical protein [Lacticaseibacillus paracasei]